ncbi:zinc-dependent alcohol dehydrogenase family protein [Streptococcus mutans]|uniref:zinc-dependent alcohol dehydrogenase family protein n=1 Tax=Streptococcus mutans TaxID=1309 RepID=UPI0002B504AD|nr:zinc-dependent alcohol dehydrogenase family protein [Streptococcus mutans]EMB91681.1 putative alcohol dehydrogenase [Streptococcus mutans A19]EMB93555.1 putative alcohol dehydrogenase [Streptococcus mutans U138]
MKTAVFVKAGQMAIETIEKPSVIEVDDAIIRVVRACVCGSDLWSYRGDDDKATHSANSGHEIIGIVDEVGSAINTVKKGDFVIAPFTHGCGYCAACRAGFEGGCQGHDRSTNFSSGYQAEYVRYAHADWSLVKIPDQPSDYSEGMIASLLALADVMPTGYHAARVANVQKGDTVAVVGDGAVGLCAVIAAKMRGAKRIIIMSRHKDRQELALEFGATDIVEERGEEGVAKVLELTNGDGVDAALECVGTQLSTETALAIARPGAAIGRVGVPHTKDINLSDYFFQNAIIAGGPASVTTYDKSVLLKAVLDGEINPGKVFTQSYSLDDIDQAYKDMQERKTIKSMVVVSK